MEGASHTVHFWPYRNTLCHRQLGEEGYRGDGNCYPRLPGVHAVKYKSADVHS
jgi:hypothetical protein